MACVKKCPENKACGEMNDGSSTMNMCFIKEKCNTEFIDGSGDKV